MQLYKYHRRTECFVNNVNVTVALVLFCVGFSLVGNIFNCLGARGVVYVFPRKWAFFVHTVGIPLWKYTLSTTNVHVTSLSTRWCCLGSDLKMQMMTVSVISNTYC